MSVVGERLLRLLDAHRVLTTGQLARLTAAPERTTEYRLARLAERRLVGRVRPARSRGSAPWHWWLTTTGARLVNGTACATEHRQPNPLFLAHTTAIAESYLALRDHGAAVGLELTGWWADAAGWQEWRPGARSGYPGRVKRITPDATAHLSVQLPDGGTGWGVCWIEVDLATMTAERLRHKLHRYLDYTTDVAWRGKHPHCPLLLVLTTTPGRVATFCRGAARTLPDERPRPYSDADDQIVEAAQRLVVAAAGWVRDPATAITERVWQLPDDTEISLRDLLVERITAEQDARRVWAWRAEQAAREEYRQALHRIACAQNLPDRLLDDPAAEAVLRLLAGSGDNTLLVWADEHREQARALVDSWPYPATAEGFRDAWPPPAGLVAALAGEYLPRWREQATRLLTADEAITTESPDWQVAAARLLTGQLLDAWQLERATTPRYGRAEAQALLWHDAASGRLDRDYPNVREQAVREQWTQLGFLARRRTSLRQLAETYDAAHLRACPGCALTIPVERAGHACGICATPFHAAATARPVPVLVAELRTALTNDTLPDVAGGVGW